MILALDLGTRCGWALWDGHRIESGVQVFDLRRGESPGMRFIRFNRWLDDLGRGPAALPVKYSAKLAVYEAPHHRGGAATEIAVGMSTRVQEWCARFEIQHAAVHSATLKKWTTGSGRGDKTAMLEAVERRWGIKAADDNEADAVALLMYAREMSGPLPGEAAAVVEASNLSTIEP